MMFWSKYNILLTSTRLSRHFLYNTCHATTFELSPDEFLLFKNVSEHKISIDTLPAETIGLLQNNRILTQNDSTEFLKYKTTLQAHRFDKEKLQLIIYLDNKPARNTSSSRLARINMLHGLLNFIQIHHPKNLHIFWFCTSTIPFSFIQQADFFIKTLKTASYLSEIIISEEWLQMQHISKIKDFINKIRIITPEITDPTEISLKTDSLSKKIEKLLFHGITVHCDIHQQNSILKKALDNSYQKYSFSSKLINLDVNNGLKYSCSGCSSEQSGLPVRITFECFARHINSFIIDKNGFVYKCWLDLINHQRAVTHLIDNSNNKQDVYLQYLSDKDHLDNPQCQNCKFIFLCNGGCPHFNIRTNHFPVCHLNEESLLIKIENNYEKEYSVEK